MRRTTQSILLAALLPLTRHSLLAAGQNLPGPSQYQASGEFPTSLFSSYYNNPTATTAQPQPVISDPVTETTYPYNLTDASIVRTTELDTEDYHALNAPATAEYVYAQAVAQIQSIVSSPLYTNDSCNKCHQAIQVSKFVSLAYPEISANVSVQICTLFGLASEEACFLNDGPYNVGNIVSQVISMADVAGADGDAYCNMFFGAGCPVPTVLPLNMTGYFAKPKPNPLPPLPKSEGKRLKVVHLSDFHLDARYMNGAEANCTGQLCCRSGVTNPTSPNATLLPAPRFGSYLCDAPLSLEVAALSAVRELAAGTIDFSIFTGDLVSHDNENQLSEDHTKYSEVISFELFAKYLGSGKLEVYPTLGNHDTFATAQTAPPSLPPPLDVQFQWNYEEYADLSEMQSWLDPVTAAEARTRQGMYSIRTPLGLHIISLNTDFWYNNNVFNYIGYLDSDNSEMLRFLADELQRIEDLGERAWIIGHVPPNSSPDAVPAPTNLLYQIIDRYSPHVIAETFWGHTHDDRVLLYYANNGTNMSAETALTSGWVGPSVTPYTKVNSGFRIYDIDSGTFNVLDSFTYISNVTLYPGLDETSKGPTFELEYSARETYGKDIKWPLDAPLNATWWHLVTQAMEADPSLVQTYQYLQSKSSPYTLPCDEECVQAKICYIRSGSVPLAEEFCKSGYESAI